MALADDHLHIGTDPAGAHWYIKTHFLCQWKMTWKSPWHIQICCKHLVCMIYLYTMDTIWMYIYDVYQLGKCAIESSLDFDRCHVHHP